LDTEINRLEIKQNEKIKKYEEEIKKLEEEIKKLEEEIKKLEIKKEEGLKKLEENTQREENIAKLKQNIAKLELQRKEEIKKLELQLEEEIKKLEIKKEEELKKLEENTQREENIKKREEEIEKLELQLEEKFTKLDENINKLEIQYKEEFAKLELQLEYEFAKLEIKKEEELKKLEENTQREENIAKLKQDIAKLELQCKEEIEKLDEESKTLKQERKIKELELQCEENIAKLEIQREENIKKREENTAKLELQYEEDIHELELQHEKNIQQLEISEVQDIENIPLSSWYEQRNEKLKREYKKNQEESKSRDLRNRCSQKKEFLELTHQENIQNEKIESKNQIEIKRQTEIEKRNLELTERHFYIYFKYEDDFDDIHPEKLNKKLSTYKFLVYDNKAEKAKIKRQRQALDSFFRGYVKNPFLASYLFMPETLGKSETEQQSEIEWYNNRLNDRQKEAVRKALASNSLFLLQGPPGTGKTEFIAETTAQYVKQGKKVFISSETHKAIDNVFERLPKIPEIRPLRLIPSESKKVSEYSPEKLVDNLYESIVQRCNKRIQQYENFVDMKDNFKDKMKELRFRYDHLLKLNTSCQNSQNKKKELEDKRKLQDELIEEKRSMMQPLGEEKDKYFHLRSCIERGDFEEDIEKKDVLHEIMEKLCSIVSKYDFFKNHNSETIQTIYKLDLEQVQEEFKTIGENSTALSVEQQKESLRAKMRALRDLDTDEIIEGKEGEYKKLQKELISLKDVEDTKNNIDYSSFVVATIISADQLNNSITRGKILQDLVEIKSEIAKYVKKQKSDIQNLINGFDQKINKINDEITEIKQIKNDLSSQIEEINHDETYSDYRRKQQELRKEIVDFFDEFEILEEYPANDFDKALDIINKHWNEIEHNQEEKIKENKSNIPMYKRIRDYLSDEEILEEDRISYTKNLFDNANVFGMTCTSREYFNERSMESLEKYKLGEINVKSVGIDVVIIDEVSKSSFLDLLIPILYGKTVILVGDHRQLPPLYDLKYLRKDDFVGLDEEKIDFDTNKKYQELYETCFFKKLFEQVPDSYRIMLNKQYRSHSHIMDVVNYFYYSADGKKGLSIGLSNQNDFKQHHLLIKKKNNTIIEPDNHIYFVNCTGIESRVEDSSSIVNIEEAEVAHQLLTWIDEEYGRLIKSGKIQNNDKKDERKSIGIICTYGDQAREIRKKSKGQKYSNISQKREEKFIVSTVDDFQGDERDIIIVSMVRNPKGNRYSSDFIDQYERINVAFSRARCMLIIIGSQEFLSKSRIYLPDINGRKELDIPSFPVYEKIIRTIQVKGKLLQATDILGEVKKDGK